MNYYVSDSPNCRCLHFDVSHSNELLEHGMIKSSLWHSKDKVGSWERFAAWGVVDDSKLSFPLETLSKLHIGCLGKLKTSCKKMSFPSTTFDNCNVLLAILFTSWFSFLCLLYALIQCFLFSPIPKSNQYLLILN